MVTNYRVRIQLILLNASRVGMFDALFTDARIIMS